MKFHYLLIGFAGILCIQCSDQFFDSSPKGTVSLSVIHNEQQVNALLIGAYAMLDGAGADPVWGGGFAWAGSVSNWVWGDVLSDDAYMGGASGSSSSLSVGLETFQNTSPSNSIFNDKWTVDYEGVGRCNDVLLALAVADQISDAKKEELAAEARFLRAHYHFELLRVFQHVPWIDEEVDMFHPVGNHVDIWPKLEEDLKFAGNHLPGKQEQIGRATSWAAKALLAKVLLFQHKYEEATPYLDDILENGPFSLMDNYEDNYRIATNNNQESIFEVQYSVNDGTPESFNGGYGDALNFPSKGPFRTCCSFHTPSQNLVNAFRTDENGLPFLDTFNEIQVTSDLAIDSEESFTPYAGTLDPRLDWTVGRRGIPYLDWGIHPGSDWVNDAWVCGPYLNKKNMFTREEDQQGLRNTSGWATGVNANNYRIIKLSQVILWRAECAAESGNLTLACELVNRIRRRARDGEVVRLPDGTPAANYLVGEYSVFPDKEFAIKAIHFETRLELAMEGHRFFDLVRWGEIQPTMSDYFLTEKEFQVYLETATFTNDKDEYRPIPQKQIDITGLNEKGEPLLRQNSGY